MINSLLPEKYIMVVSFLAAFVLNTLSICLFRKKLPRDMGRAFAVNGNQSKGKERGAGIILIIVYALCSLLFNEINLEDTAYIVLMVAVMLTGFFDDASKKPWGNMIKGILDTCIAAGTAFIYLSYNDNTINLPFTSTMLSIPVPLFFILIVAFIFVSINVVNCSDGVDGLCTSLSLAGLMSFLCASGLTKNEKNDVVIFAAVLISYLWFNIKPSSMLMGDAGSRSIGLYLAILALKSKNPLLYIPFVFVMIVDGGLGLIKLSVLRLEKKFLKLENPSFMKNIRTPLHDHVRKNLPEEKRWSDTQVTGRFLLIQIIISAVTAGLLL